MPSRSLLNKSPCIAVEPSANSKKCPTKEATMTYDLYEIKHYPSAPHVSCDESYSFGIRVAIDRYSAPPQLFTHNAPYEVASLQGNQLIGFYASTKVPMRSFRNDCTGLGRRCICRCRLLKQNGSADSFKCFGTLTS